MTRKFKKDTPVVHLKTLVRGTVTLHDGEKVTYLKEDGTTSTVNEKSLQTVTQWEGEQARAKKKAEAEQAKKDKAAARAAAPKRERQAASKEGYVKSGKLEYDPSKYIPRDGEVKTASGTKIRDVGDAAADEMAGKSFSEMVAITSRSTGIPRKDLEDKYGKLNPGMQRMTLGNKHRAALKAIAEGNDPKAPKPAKVVKEKAPAKEAKVPKGDKAAATKAPPKPRGGKAKAPAEGAEATA